MDIIIMCFNTIHDKLEFKPVRMPLLHSRMELEAGNKQAVIAPPLARPLQVAPLPPCGLLVSATEAVTPRVYLKLYLRWSLRILTVITHWPALRVIAQYPAHVYPAVII